MSFVPYEPSSHPWLNLQQQPYGKKFYDIQKGGGNPIKVVTPAAANVERAKMDLKRQMSENLAHSSPSKRRKRATKTGPTAKKKKKGKRVKKRKKPLLKKKKKKGVKRLKSKK